MSSIVSSNSFGELIRNRRKEKKLSLHELFARSGVTPSYISKIETGNRRTPSVVIVQNLCKALEIDISQVLNAFSNGNVISEALNPVMVMGAVDVEFAGVILTNNQKNSLIKLLTLLESNIISNSNSANIDIMNAVESFLQKFK